MDEIWDRIKSNFKNSKIKHKHLVLALASTEILGILVFLWILRIPLSQKFFTTEPKAYSVVSLNPKKRYLISQGDQLTGKAIPGTNVKVLITPGSLKAQIQADSKGNWWYQIPPNLEKKVHTITFGNFDKKNKLVTFQSYKFRVQSNNPIFRFTDSIFKIAHAQTNSESFNYANYGLPNANGQIELTDDEKFRLREYFLPYAYPAAKITGADWKLMAMWIYTEAYLTNYMDNCLDGNPDWGEDADPNQNTTCTGWVKDDAPNWQVGWGIFPYQWIDRLPEAIAVMRPGESVQQIGQRVINESREKDRYPTRGIVIYKEPSDPITNPETFPDISLEQIIDGAKPVGDREQTKPCPRSEKDYIKNFRKDQDPKDCDMRQLLGILMKDPAISAYFLALMWKDLTDKGSLKATFENWGSEYGPDNKLKNPYFNAQKISNTIAAIETASSGLDLEAIAYTPKVIMPTVIASTQATQDPVYPIDGVQAETVVSQGGRALDEKQVEESNLSKIVIVVPSGTNINDFLCSERYGNCPEPQNFDFNPTSKDVKGVSTSQEIELDPDALTNPSEYQVCALLKPIDFNVVIDSDCTPLDQVIDPQIPSDTTTTSEEATASCEINPEAGEFFCAEGVCRSTEYDCSSGRRWYFDEFKNPQNGCEFEAKPNTEGEFKDLWYHGDLDDACSEPIPDSIDEPTSTPNEEETIQPENEPQNLPQEDPQPEPQTEEPNSEPDVTNYIEPE